MRFLLEGWTPARFHVCWVCLGIVWAQLGYGAEPTYVELKAENAQLRAQIKELTKEPYWITDGRKKQKEIDESNKRSAAKSLAQNQAELHWLQSDPRGIRKADKKHIQNLKMWIAEDDEFLETGNWWGVN